MQLLQHQIVMIHSLVDPGRRLIALGPEAPSNASLSPCLRDGRKEDAWQATKAARSAFISLKAFPSSQLSFYQPCVGLLTMDGVSVAASIVGIAATGFQVSIELVKLTTQISTASERVTSIRNDVSCSPHIRHTLSVG